MAIFIAVVALAALVAGCGSGGDDSTVTVTKAQYTKKADAVCVKNSGAITQRFHAYVVKFEKENKKEPGTGQHVMIAEKVLLPGFQTEAEELRELDAPAEDEEQITAMLDAFEKGIEEGEENPKPFVIKGSPSFRRALDIATKYGLESCGHL
jgi:hypothetical protein